MGACPKTFFATLLFTDACVTCGENTCPQWIVTAPVPSLHSSFPICRRLPWTAVFLSGVTAQPQTAVLTCSHPEGGCLSLLCRRLHLPLSLLALCKTHRASGLRTASLPPFGLTIPPQGCAQVEQLLSCCKLLSFTFAPLAGQCRPHVSIAAAPGWLRKSYHSWDLWKE